VRLLIFVLFFLLGLLSFFPLSSASSNFLDEELPPKNSMIDDWERMSSELLKPPPLSWTAWLRRP